VTKERRTDQTAGKSGAVDEVAALFYFVVVAAAAVAQHLATVQQRGIILTMTFPTLSDNPVWWMEVLIAPVILVVLAQCVQFRCCRLPRWYNSTERKIMFRPLQNGTPKKIFEFGEALIGTKPLIGLRNDVMYSLNSSKGGMLALCAPFGHGKTTTAIGAAMAHLDGMPRRVLCLTIPLDGNWYTDVKNLSGIPFKSSGGGGARHLYSAMANKSISTKRSRRMRVLDAESVLADCDMPQNKRVSDYGVLVIEDYSPPELEDLDGSSLRELEEALVDKEAYYFLKTLAQYCYEGYVVVVVTTTCQNTLRLIHHGINGGHKAKAAPFTTIHAGTEAMNSVIEMPRDHVGMNWDQTSRLELLSKKYGPWTTTAEGKAKAEELAATQESIRDCCQILYLGNGSSCVTIHPGFWDSVDHYIVDPIQRLSQAQPACNLVDTTTEDPDIEMGNTGYSRMGGAMA
jgi:hypothetical protein